MPKYRTTEGHGIALTFAVIVHKISCSVITFIRKESHLKSNRSTSTAVACAILLILLLPVLLPRLLPLVFCATANAKY